jgi:P4 family phage/plasmid primase-like protien
MESTNSLDQTPIIPSITSYRNFDDFLAKHVIQKNANTPNTKIITNTRIGDQSAGIFGGSYHIPDSEYATFLNLYARDVLSNPTKKEYLTEKQRENDGPILIDMDFRHTYETEERQYDKDYIDDFIDATLEELCKIYQLDDNSKFQIFIFEKPTVNRVHDKKITKDGIHIIICIQVDHITQQILREQLIVRAKEMWTDFPITNTWEDVFDEGISKGHVNWQLYGSRKPNHERYKLTRIIDVSYDSNDDTFRIPDIPLSKFDINANIHKLSVRNKDNISLFMKSTFVNKYEEFKRVNKIGGGNSQGMVVSSSNNRLNQLEIMDDISTVSRIKNADELEMVLNHFLDNNVDSPTNYELKETYDYLMCLPASYYGPGSYSKWIRVGWVLRNTSNKLLIAWIKFSSQSSEFLYSSIPDLCELWRKFDMRKHGGLTRRSLRHWAHEDAREAYEKVYINTIDYYVENTLNSCSSKLDKSGCGDFDIANVLYHIYGAEYVCVSVKGNIWYHYNKNRWQVNDSGTTLRKAISVQLRDIYNKKSQGLMHTISVRADGGNNEIVQSNHNQQQQQEVPASEEYGKNRSSKILGICQRLGKTTDKKNIMTEAKELFYDGSFLSKLDTNPYLLCFTNGVIDFKNKEFRKGQPEDNISMCTNINYTPLTPAIHQPIIDEINDFMRKLFPEPSLCEYMWDHLASTLSGTSVNQTFNMYIGAGQNGKSVLVDLMSKVLGEYKGDVPLTLVTDKRGKVGGLAPEIVQLKGIRYAVMQEPSKGDVINEGIMKQLTSGKDPIQGRAPYMPETISFLPQFSLVVTCNTLMGVKANDHGTWRRIRACPFKSLFTENPVEGDKEKPYQFKLDKYIDEKFDDWKEVFAAMLVARAFATNGIVKDCDIVMAKSNEYRQSQDYISEFVNDRVVRDAVGKIKKMELNNEFSIWHMANYGGKGPSPKDLHEFMDKEFGRQQNSTWSGVKIRYERDEVQFETEETDGESDIALSDL